MYRTIEARIDENGNVKLLEPVRLSGCRRALLTILDVEAAMDPFTMNSEAALAKDWNRPEEDAAWSQLKAE